MRRLLRLALPLGLLAALAVPTSALAQVTVSTNSSGGLALLASSPTGRDTTAVTGNTTLDSSWITNVSDSRLASFGDGISGPGIPGGSATISTAIRSGGTVAGNTIAAANANPPGATESGNTVTINMTTPHNFQVGDSVVIAGVAVGGYNGTFTVTGTPTLTSFTYTNPTAGLGNSGGGTATGPNPGLSEVGNTVTVRLGFFDHNLVVGHSVTITGAGNALYNGTWTVTGTPTSSSFTFTHPTSGIASAWGGTVTPFATFLTAAPHGLSVGSSVTIEGVATAGYNGTFTVLTVPTATTFTTSSTAQLLPSGGGTASTQTTVIGVGTTSNALIDPVGLDNSILWETKALPADAGDGATVTYNDPGGLAATLGASVAGGDDITINLGRGFVGANASNNIAASPGGATEAGNTVTITTTAAHNLHVGQTVTIAGVAEPLYNGTFAVLSTPTTTTFTYTNPNAGLAGSGGGTVQGSGIQAVAAGGAGGTISLATHAGTTVTMTTSAVHNLRVGQLVTVSGVSVAAYNGTFQIATVPSTTTFTYTTPTGLTPFAQAGGTFTIAAAPGGATSTGNTVTLTTTAAHNITAGETITVAGVADATYNGTFTVNTVPTATTLTYTNATADIPASGGGTVSHTSGGTATGNSGASESGNTVTITTRAAHGLQVGQSVTIDGVLDNGYNGTFTVDSVPTTNSFTYNNPTGGLAASGGGQVYTVTTTAAQLITAANGGAGDFAAVTPLVSATASGAVTGRLAGVSSSVLNGGDNNTLQLSQPASATASGVNLSLSSARRNGDMAFWGDTLIQGSDSGFRVFDISNPASPALDSDYSCNGGSGDVSVWENLVFKSVDVPQSAASCAGSADQYWKTTGGNHTATAQSTRIAPGFEGIRIVDISNPSAPAFVAGVATDCGSFSHTLIPDTANDRVYLYVSSFPNAAIDATPTTYGNSCELLAPGSPAAPNQISGHDKITIIEVPLSNPASAHVVDEVTLGLKGYNSFFAHIPGYTGDYNNMPGYKGCHDIAVSMATHTAAAACVTEGVTLDISNPAAPTVEDHFVNPDIDLCATGVYRWAGGTSTQAATPLCMWGTATFTYDGKRIIWGNTASGHAGCGSNSTTVALSCNPRGNTNASVDRFYDGQSTSNECETGAGTAPIRSPYNRGAFWMNNADDASWPISQVKIPYSVDATVNRYELYSSQGCSASLGNVVPVNGKYILPLSWQIGGMNVVDWTNYLNPTELGWFDVNTSATEAGNANPLNRPAGNSALKSNAYAAYFYNGYVYVSNQAPAYGSWYPDGSRGLEVFSLTDASVSGAFDLPHLNPQTQESLLTCSIAINGSPKVGVKRTIKVSVGVMGQGVKGAVVKAKTHSYNASKTTPANGQVSFSFKPNKKAKTLTFSVAAQTNMLGCSKSKNVAK